MEEHAHENATTRRFDLGDVLSITTGRLVSRRHMEGVYDILNYMTGDNLFTHQLPRAARECKEPLLGQHSALREVVVPELDAEMYEAWLDGMSQRYGATLDVRPLGPGEHTQIGPLTEFAMMRGGDTSSIIPVVIDEDGPR